MSGSSQPEGAGHPKVSVLLPNLNTRAFLEERMESILAQTFPDWELVVVDSYSEDGAWEYFQHCASGDRRIRISQAPREGVYAGLNRCLGFARGEFVYFATSDDTMTPDCLEKMTAALDAHPDCGMAVCCFRTIDEHGREIPGTWEGYEGNRALGDRLKSTHVRYPPYDTIVNCAWDTTYISLTQLLIRKSALDRIGFFRTDFGSWGDFEWNVRSSFLTPRVHVPEFLATWRRTPGQATQDAALSTAAWHWKAVEMIRLAYQAASAVDPSSVRSVRLRDLLLPHVQQAIAATIRESPNFSQRLSRLPALFVGFPHALLTYVLHRTVNRHSIFGLGSRQVRRLLDRANLAEGN